MQIVHDNVKYHNNYNAFKANIKSLKLNFSQKDFFIRIRGYGKNTNWATKAKDAADTATELIRMKVSAENTLKIIALNIKEANNLLINLAKGKHTGLLRIPREGWNGPSKEWGSCNLVTNYTKSKRYRPYGEKLDKAIKRPLNQPFAGISLTRAKIGEDGHYLRHGTPKLLPSALKHIFKTYDKFINKFNYKTVNENQLTEINNDIAKIRWLLAHSTPWERGSDAISNVFMRAMYKSLGIKTYPIKKGISLDLEAYCNNLRDYKKNFTNYFDQKPRIIN